MKDIVEKYKNSNANAAIHTLRKQLKQLVEQLSNLHRKYNWYTIAQLKNGIKEINSCVTLKGRKPDLLNLLVDLELKQALRNDAIASGKVRNIASLFLLLLLQY